MIVRGGCHCGAIEVRYRSAVPPSRAEVRACQCTFCRKHGARAVSDPRGGALIIVHDTESLNTYMFALRTAAYLICGRCGVYLGAMMTEGNRAYATLNINAFDASGGMTSPALPVRYDAETAHQRRARRRRQWTPARIEYAKVETRPS